MRNKCIYVVITAFLLMTVGCTNVSNKTSNKMSNSFVEFKPFESKTSKKVVDSIYDHMTDAERLTQLYGTRTKELLDESGKKLSIENCKKIIPNGVGHLSQFACLEDINPDEQRDLIRDLQDYVKKYTHTGVPVLVHEEAITGLASKGSTVYPQQIGASCSWNPELITLKSNQTSEVMRECGALQMLSPMLDVIRTPHFNRVEESYGEDSYLVSRLGVAFVSGMNRGDYRKGISTCTKHFLGYGGGSENSQKTIIEEILMPHEAAFKLGGNKVIMPGYHIFRDEYSFFNKKMLQGLWRDTIGFDGVIVSDYGAMDKELNVDKNDFTKRAADALKAGSDVEFPYPVNMPHMFEAIEKGLVSREAFERSVKRVLTLKYNLGLFDKNYEPGAKGHLDFDKREYRKTAYDLAVQSLVLLKNKGGILPLDPDSNQKIALVGPNANSIWAMLGDYTYQSLYAFWAQGTIQKDQPKIYTVYESIKNRLGDKADSK